jgi:transcription initiation factor TFIIIB Brf1 subunit/transcription initiation factor TFIIB
MAEFEIFNEAIKSFECGGSDVDDERVDVEGVDDKRKEAFEIREFSDSVFFDLSCKHLNTLDENNVVLCVDCGAEISKQILHDKEWRYYGHADSKNGVDPTRVQMRKYDERTIFKDVENMGFSDKITLTANSIYTEVTKGKIKRGNSRKAIVFACIYQAFLLSDFPKTHDALIKIFGLTRKTGLQGLKHVKLNTPKGHAIHLMHINPRHIIMDIMDKFSAKDHQKMEIVELYMKVKNKDVKLSRSRPQSIAAGITFYWICINNIEVTLKEFARKVGLSELTIGKMAKLIASILDTRLEFHTVMV